MATDKSASHNIKDIISAFESKSVQSNGATELDCSKDRVKMLENHLRTTLDNFSKKDLSHLESSSDHSDRSSIIEENVNASNDDMTSKFKTYVRTVRLFADSKKKIDDAHLFSSCFLVGLCGREPYIKYRFPPNVIIITTKVLCFCL